MMKALNILASLYKEVLHWENLGIACTYTSYEINEAITELEALQEPKSCDGCAWAGHDRWSVCASCSRPSRRDFYLKDTK